MTLKRDKLLAGIVLIVIGILFLAAPTSSAKAVAAVIGIILTLAGLVHGYVAIRNKDGGLFKTMLLVFSVLLIVLGIFLLANPGYLVAYSYIIFGVVMILNAAANILGVLRNNIQVTGSKMVYILLSSVLAVVGVIVLFNPFSASDVMMRIIGVMLMAGGAVNLLIGTRMLPNK